MDWKTPVPTTRDVRQMLALAAVLDGHLHDWHSSLPPMLQFNEPAGYKLTPHTDDYIQILRHRYLTCKELLCRPFVRLVVETPMSFGEQLTAQVLIRASVCLQYCMLKLSQVAPHRHQGTWFGLRNAASALLILCSVNLAHRSRPTSRDLHLPEGWDTTAHHAVEVLRPLCHEERGGASSIGRLLQYVLIATATAA